MTFTQYIKVSENFSKNIILPTEHMSLKSLSLLSGVAKVGHAVRSVFHFFSWIVSNSIRIVSKDKLLADTASRQFQALTEHHQQAGHIGYVGLAIGLLLAAYFSKSSKPAIIPKPAVIPKNESLDGTIDACSKPAIIPKPAVIPKSESPDNPTKKTKPESGLTTHPLFASFNYTFGLLFSGNPQIRFEDLPVCNIENPEAITLKHLGANSIMKTEIKNDTQTVFIRISRQINGINQGKDTIIIIQHKLPPDEDVEAGKQNPLLSYPLTSPTYSLLKVNAPLNTSQEFNIEAMRRLLHGESIESKDGGSYRIVRIKKPMQIQTQEYYLNLSKEHALEGQRLLNPVQEAILSNHSISSTSSAHSSASSSPQKKPLPTTPLKVKSKVDQGDPSTPLPLPLPSPQEKNVTLEKVSLDNFNQTQIALFNKAFHDLFDHTQIAFKAVPKILEGAEPLRITEEYMKKNSTILGKTSDEAPFVVIALKHENKSTQSMTPKKGNSVNFEPEYLLIIQAEYALRNTITNTDSVAFNLHLKDLKNERLDQIFINQSIIRDLLKNGKTTALVNGQTLVIAK